MFSANISVCSINVGVGETMLEDALSLLPDTTVKHTWYITFNSFFCHTNCIGFYVNVLFYLIIML